MADCYYHGESGSGPCPECESLRKEFPDKTVEEATKLREEDWKRKTAKSDGTPYRNAWGNEA